MARKEGTLKGMYCVLSQLKKSFNDFKMDLKAPF
jgi:hypothetical protein